LLTGGRRRSTVVVEVDDGEQTAAMAVDGGRQRTPGGGKT